MSKRIFRIAIMTLALLALTATVALADENGSPLGQMGDETTDALWATLAPIVAIATSTERILEMFWDRWERNGAWPNKNGVTDTSSSGYIMKKKTGSHWLGTLVALIAVGLTNARFFRLLGLEVLFSDIPLFTSSIGGIFDEFTIGTLVDWALTAGIVGWGGTELTHSVIEGLVKGRNLWKEMQEVEEGRKSILDAKFFNNYIVPELKKHGISTDALRQTLQTLQAANVPVDQFISSMTTGKVDQFLNQLEAKPETAQAVKAVRTLLEGAPPERLMEFPNVLNLLTTEQRKRFLGA